MNIAQIEQNLQDLILDFNKETFIFELLLAYGSPKASITRLQKGNLNLSKIEGEISWKKKVFFKPVFNQDLHLAISEIKNTLKHEQRFVVVTDFKTLLAIDTKTSDSLDIEFTELPKHFDFFLPWAGMEKATHQNENPADVKAAEKMAKLFDEIKKDNPDNSPEFIHGLNVFLSRLLFCFFAEDTNIFKKSQFTNAISSHTQTNGSDLSDYINKLFDVLNTHDRNRKNLPAYLSDFPYVNGGLFEHEHPTPVFTRRSRQAVIDAGELLWSDINPDIFGSMFQAVISIDQRGSLGQHYTSVPNIMKVIEPLFLHDLNEEFENGKYEPRKLNKLLERISKIKIFDPACGSGNFLIIAYKELRLLEIKILLQLQELQKATTGFEGYQSELDLIPKAQLTLAAQYQPTLFSRIELSQFFGIEIDDFAHEIAILSLWLAQHQMNQKFKEILGESTPTLPLQAGGNIVHGNATREDWEIVCPKLPNYETYILGNPPYLGSSMQNAEQKEDMAFVFKGFNNYKNLDYIAAWFIKGANYIQNHNAQFAFVSTNSICQGEQVALLWPPIFDKNLEIGFAHTSFKWNNSAKANAAVIVIIVGIRNNLKKEKYLFSERRKYIATNINAYLANAQNIIVEKRNENLALLPKMTYGNKAVYGEPLILSIEERSKIVNEVNDVSKFIKKFVGAKELIDCTERWVIWIRENQLKEASSFNFINDRIEKVRKLRLASNEKGANELANKPHQFRDTFETSTNSIIIPLTSSERREYIPLGYLSNEVILSNAVSVVYDAVPWVFSIISSKSHMTWMRTVAGRLKTDYRYSSQLCYNTFPFPKISESQKDELTQSVFRILEERENHSEKTLAQLYDPKKMPEGLREVHRLNDLVVERCYRSKPFESDEERLEYLFKLYEKMIKDEKEKEASLKAEKKIKKQK
jgi:type I restriction-modification system DNA methylase subunit